MELGVWIHNSFEVAKQFVAVTKKANCVLGIIKRNFIYKEKQIIVRLCSSVSHLWGLTWTTVCRSGDHIYVKILIYFRMSNTEPQSKYQACNTCVRKDWDKYATICQSQPGAGETILYLMLSSNLHITLLLQQQRGCKPRIRFDVRKHFYNQRVIASPTVIVPRHQPLIDTLINLQNLNPAVSMSWVFF